jgi:hypothetical protein
MTNKWFIRVVAVLVFAICAFAFAADRGYPLAWYFLAKGIFCSVSLILTQELLEVLRNL